MNEALSAAMIVLTSAAPVLFAAMGALVTEYAGVLAVFMDGAITLSGFICVAVTEATGNPTAGFAVSAAGVTALMLLVAFFTEKTKANPFLTGLAVNFLAQGLTSLLSVSLFGTRGVVALGEETLAPWRGFSAGIPASLASVPVLAVLLGRTVAGINLRVTGSDPELLASRGVNPAKYRALAWGIAAFFAACAGSTLALDLGAFTPALSGGRGWTALAAVYLGYKRPATVALAVIAFAAAGIIANGLQGSLAVPATLVLALPYALALIAFALVPAKIAKSSEIT